jgi:hypothetical protein
MQRSYWVFINWSCLFSNASFANDRCLYFSNVDEIASIVAVYFFWLKSFVRSLMKIKQTKTASKAHTWNLILNYVKIFSNNLIIVWYFGPVNAFERHFFTSLIIFGIMKLLTLDGLWTPLVWIIGSFGWS